MRYSNRLLIIFFLFFTFSSGLINANANEIRGIRLVAFDKATEQKMELQLYEKAYAVIIGIDYYKNLKYDEQLSYAVRDAKGVEAVLSKNYKFDKIITLYNKNATKENIMKVLSGDLSKINKEDSVFIFWAGHGYTEKTDFGELGYLLPFDGTFEQANLYKNISMTMIKDDISKRIPAKHIFFVMDSCYSGLMVAKRGAPRKSERDYSYLKEITRENVRQVLTAGSKEQQVLDGGPLGHSVFTGRLIEILENTEDFITASELSTMLKEKVFSDAKARNHTQTPKFGELFGVGDYVFVPSIEQKVNETKAKINDMQKEIARLNDLEQASLKAKDERAGRQAELEKRVIEAKLKAAQLRQEALEENRKKRKEEEKERLRREQALIESKKAEEERLTMLSQKVIEKRQSLQDITMSSLSPVATIKEMQEIDRKLKKIKEDFRKELVDGINMIITRLNPKFEKIVSFKQDEFESKEEFNARIEKIRTELEQEQTNEIATLQGKLLSEYDKQIVPFIEQLKKLSGNEFTFTAEKLILELHKYDAISNNYPVTIKSKEPINGKLITASANIPIPRDEAREFSQHYKSNILRPKIKGYFQGINLFGIKEACIINDATNKKYDIFSSAFVDFGNGIVYDTVLKILWSKNVNHFGKEFYYWSDAIRASNNTEVGGLLGWRISTEYEITRIYNLYKNKKKLPFDMPEYFEIKLEDDNTERGRVCTFTFKIKGYKAGEKSCGDNANWKGYAWPVRENGSEDFGKRYVFFDSDFLDLGNGIIYDAVTKLLICKNVNHLGKKFYYWNEANKAVKNTKIDGLSGWRMILKKELDRLYSHYRDYQIFHNNNEKYPFDMPKYVQIKLEDYNTEKGKVCVFMFSTNGYKEGEKSCWDNANWKGYAWPVRGGSSKNR